MNIRINKKLVAILVATTMGFSLCSCAKQDETNVDSISFDSVIDAVEDDSLTDEVLDYSTIDIVNPFSLEYENTIDLMDAANYLENTLELSQEFSKMMEIPILSEDAEDYYMVEVASDWKPEEVYKLIDDYFYKKDDEQKSAGQKLTYYKTYLDKELRINGINIGTALLEASIKSKVLDAYEGDIEDLGMINIYGNSVFYNNKKLLFNDNYELSLLDNLYNIYYNREEFTEFVDFRGLNSVLTETMDATKGVIFKDFIVDNNKVKSI